ncbi:MAG: SUMF1/EgtB/PvdO family nonheme iron enzyme [Rubripirellula sp.]|nr:SUMF1/EgtB/PvdO family nonheme iron enzyme [Rubripirellula sp.]
MIRDLTMSDSMTSDSPTTIRIFISSPGDVIEERNGAKRVIEGLQRLYPMARLQAVLWEDLALTATASFQQTIDDLLEREPIDIAVFILWSRLGSPLGAGIARPDGTPYRSGTEREFELMLALYEQSGRKRPVILTYVRDDDAGFKQKLARSPKGKLAELIEQQQLAEGFIVEQFHDHEGHNLRAYLVYSEPVSFIQRLRVHLRRAVDDLLDVESVVWTEDPYRGLETFGIEHAPIFYGREEETCDLLQILRDQQRAGCAFVVIVGASGSGKSSLARAGVAANLVQHFDEGGSRWHVTTFVPGLEDQSLCHALARSLAEVLPDLIDSAAAVERIAKGLAENAQLTVDLAISTAFADSEQPIRWLLVLDQMEELWTDCETTEDDRERFLTAINALAKTGHVDVLATLRSDFYHHAQASPMFLNLKGQRGQYDLLPPDAGSIRRLITEPARLSGLKFERNEQSGRSLDEVVLKDASRASDSLPLLEYTLAELFRQRDQERHLLTYSAYHDLGGVEGAIGKRAEQVIADLPSESRDALGDVLPLLISLDVAGEHRTARRRATIADLTATPARQELTERLVAARFLTTDRQNGQSIASFAHEALLHSWKLVTDWIEVNRENLRLRTGVEQLQQRWEQQGHDDSLLLAEGVPLEEGRHLLRHAPQLLTDSVKDYIEVSIHHRERMVNQARRQRFAVLSSIAMLLVVMIIGGVYIRRSTNATRLVEALLKANTIEVPNILAGLASYSILAHDPLVTKFNESEDDSDAKLHAALALLDRDDRALAFLQKQILDVSAAQFNTVIGLLEDHRDYLIKPCWKIVKDRELDDARCFQAACVLAAYDSENPNWQDQDLNEFVIDYLVKVLPSELQHFRDALYPVRGQLTDSLSVIYRDHDRDSQVRAFATDILADYLSDDADDLFGLLVDSNEKQFEPMFSKLQNHQDRAKKLADAEIAKSLPTESSEADQEALAMRQANAAVMLLRMNAADPVWPLLKQNSNPRARSYLIHWLSRRGGKPDWVIARYAKETDVTIKRALLLCLGEFEWRPAESFPLIEMLLATYRTAPDAGLHGAAEWLLRRWGQQQKVVAVDKELQQSELQFAAGRKVEREWYVNTEGQTFVMIDAGEFLMGSPETEVGHRADEQLHARRIGRRFAVATKEVTKEQWRRFSQANSEMEWAADQEQLSEFIRTDDSPMAGTFWYEAAWYCNWLSQQEGIPEEQWCYQPNEANRYAAGMKAKEDFLELTGYRLPTEAEWEFACRAGTLTSRHYGTTEDLLPAYAWTLTSDESYVHSVAKLKPNEFGLFDMHGNVFEWCYDAYDDYPLGGGLFGFFTGAKSVVEDLPSSDRVGDTGRRVLRGGAYLTQAKSVRSAFRGSYQTDFRDITGGGVRPARTLPPSP